MNGINFYPNSVGKVVLDSVKANYNNRIRGPGIALISPDIELKDVDASYNGSGGIRITPSAIGEVKVKLQGTTLLRGNRGAGFRISADDVNPLSGKVEVEGDLYIYENGGRSGFEMTANTDVNVDVKKGGSFYACGNVGEGVRRGADVINSGGGEFGKKGFTCGTGAVGNSSGGGNLPGCTPAQCIDSKAECSTQSSSRGRR